MSPTHTTPPTLDTASDAIRHVIHDTKSIPLDVADTYAALGVLSELIYQLPQALSQTIAGVTSNPDVDATSGEVAADLEAINEAIAKAATALGTAGNYVTAAHNHASRLHT